MSTVWCALWRILLVIRLIVIVLIRIVVLLLDNLDLKRILQLLILLEVW